MLTTELTSMVDERTADSHDLAGLRLEVARRVLGSRRSRIRGSRVLNVGCTDGSLESLLAEWGAIEITGIDTDEMLVETLQDRRPEFEYHTADLAQKVPKFLRGRNFDLVTAIGVLHPSKMDDESFRKMLKNLCSLCRPDGGMLLWTDHRAPHSPNRDADPIYLTIFREFSMSCRVVCPILYLPEGNVGRWGDQVGDYRGWPLPAHNAGSWFLRSCLQGGRSRPTGLTYEARLAVRRANRTRQRVPVGILGGQRGLMPVGNRRETGENAEWVTPRVSDSTLASAYPDGWRRWIEKAPVVTASGGGGGGRALLISYTFPPTGGSGVQRPAKLAKYLPEFGWSVEVLTAAHERFPWKDASLMADIPPDCRVHRVLGYEPACLARHLSACLRRVGRFLPGSFAGRDDSLLGRSIPWIEDRIYWRLARLADRLGLGNGEPLWVTPAVKAGLQRHRRHAFDVVISTGPPHFVHEVARRIACTAGIPWIAELRDPLTSDFERGKAKAPSAQQGRRLEQAIMRRASMVITTSAMLAQDLRTRYPHRAPESVAVVTNGFDRDDIVKALAHEMHRKSAAADSVLKCANGRDTAEHDAVVEPDQFLFVAAGSFYGRSELRRFVGPLSRVLERNPQWQARVRLVVAGTLDTKQRWYWEQHRPPWMTLLGYLDHVSAIREVRGASCAVMMLPECRHSRQCVPGKMFELFALPTHLLALVPPDSETQRMILEARAATVAPAEDEERVDLAIERVLVAHFSGKLSRQRDWPALDVYDRRTIAGAFADCLNSACKNDFS